MFRDPVSWLQRLNERASTSAAAAAVLADTADLLSSVPGGADEGLRIAATILAEVGCETCGDFRQLTAIASADRIAALLAPITSMSGSFGSVTEATEAVQGLSELVRDSTSGPPLFDRARPASCLQLPPSQLVRPLERGGNAGEDVGPGLSDPLPWEHSSLMDDIKKVDDVQGLLKLIGTAAGQGDGDRDSTSRKKDKVDLRALIDRAGVGEPSPDALLDDEEFKKLAAAAKMGLFGSQSSMPVLDGGAADSKSICKWLMAYTRRAIGEILLWRATPMGALSELYQVASLGADPAF